MKTKPAIRRKIVKAAKIDSNGLSGVFVAGDPAVGLDPDKAVASVLAYKDLKGFAAIQYLRTDIVTYQQQLAALGEHDSRRSGVIDMIEATQREIVRISKSL